MPESTPDYSETFEAIRDLARASAARLLEENANRDAERFWRATLEHVATLAYLDGYQRGHSDATAYAIRTVSGS